MSHDPEAAWPLTPEVGYTPAPYVPALDPAAPGAMSSPINHGLATSSPYANAGLPAVPDKKESPGILIAKLAIILGTAIPLTAIATSMVGLVGLVVVWVGIVSVAGIAMGQNTSTRPYRHRG